MESEPAESPATSGGGSQWINILDVAAKLIAAGAVVAVTVIANQFQASMTATNLLSQREQADSSLRASMLRDLIGPIVGPDKSDGVIPADRERLLVELLALNFHEHFELKPVMLHVDNRLAFEKFKDMDATQRENARRSLRSIARRVQQRQLAMLTKVESDSLPEQQACVYKLTMEVETDAEKDKDEERPSPPPCSELVRYFDEFIEIPSPSGIYTLQVMINKPERWEDENFKVVIDMIHKPRDTKSRTIYANVDFTLTWFDFPFTDNTLLADGTRFALVIDRVKYKEKEHQATLKLVWFPQDYFSERERPTNHRQLRERLGLTLQ